MYCCHVIIDCRRFNRNADKCDAAIFNQVYCFLFHCNAQKMRLSEKYYRTYAYWPSISYLLIDVNDIMIIKSFTSFDAFLDAAVSMSNMWMKIRFWISYKRRIQMIDFSSASELRQSACGWMIVSSTEIPSLDDNINGFGSCGITRIEFWVLMTFAVLPDWCRYSCEQSVWNRFSVIPVQECCAVSILWSREYMGWEILDWLPLNSCDRQPHW